MSKIYNLSELIIDHEDPYYINYAELELDTNKKKRIKEVHNGDTIRHLTFINDPKNIQSIATPDGRELTPEELFDFVIGDTITDLAKTRKTPENVADIAIVLGNITLPTTRERAIKAFELYKLGFVKKIIFTGGITRSRDKKRFMHPESLEDFMNNDSIVQDWQDLTEAYWGAETLIEDIFDKDNYQNHTQQLTEEFCNSIGINPKDILTEDISTTTQENAEYCRNIFDMEQLSTGMQINTAIIVTTCTHGNRGTRQFEKVFGDHIRLKWCPSTLDLEQYESLKTILRNSPFNENAFRQELKRIYCTVPHLTQMLREEVGHNRNVFISGYIDEPTIKVNDPEASLDR